MPSTHLWGGLKTSYVLLFESDARLCPRPTVPLEMFGAFAYVGAPWSEPFCRTHDVKQCVGNSSLSLWRREAMLDLTSHPVWPFDRDGPQQHIDVWVAQQLEARQKEAGSVLLPSADTLLSSQWRRSILGPTIRQSACIPLLLGSARQVRISLCGAVRQRRPSTHARSLHASGLGIRGRGAGHEEMNVCTYARRGQGAAGLRAKRAWRSAADFRRARRLSGTRAWGGVAASETVRASSTSFKQRKPFSLTQHGI